MFKAERNRVFKSPAFFAALAAVCVLYFFSYSILDWINMLQFPQGSVLYWMDVLYLPAVSARDLIPIAAALPFADSIANDLDGETLPQTLIRSSFARLSLSRFLSAGLSGGCVLALGRLLLLFLMISRLPFSAQNYPVFSMNYILWIADRQAFPLYLVSQAAFQFILGFWTAGFSLCVGVFTSRRGVIYTFVPFILIVLSQLAGIPLLDFFSGVSYIFGHTSHPASAPAMLLGSGVILSAAAYLMFHFSLKRRVYQ